MTPDNARGRDLAGEETIQRVRNAVVAFVADARWAFHVGVDRALGYGLKFRDRFTHTHLGEIGKD